MTSTLGVDPAFSAVVKALYGGAVDPAELAKSIDAADVHITTNVTTPKRKLRPVQKSLPVDPGDTPQKEKKVAGVGLAATGVAGLGGVHAIAATKVENAERAARAVGEIPKAKPVWVAPKVLRGVKPSTAASIIGGGALALHGVELVGDSLAARAQVKAIRANGSNAPVQKGLRLSLKPLGAPPQRVPSLRARRAAGSPAVAKALSPELASALKGVRSGRVAPFSRGSNQAKLVLKPAYAGAHRAPSELSTALKSLRKRPIAPFARVGKSLDADVEISKVDTDKRQVFGWANVSKMNGQVVRDRQGDEIDIDELEKAAYDYVLDSRIGGDQHARVSKSLDGSPKHTSDVIESMVFTPEKIEKMGLPEDFPQAWWIGMQVNDPETWELIKSGKRTGFSVHGTGRRESIEKAQTLYAGEPREKRSFDPKALSVQAAASQAPKVLKKVTVRDRLEQAKNPPPVRRRGVSSAAVRSIGYQPQTRRLSVEMTTRPGQPYEYRTKKKVANRVINADSKGRAYNAEIRNKQPRHDHFTVGDRGRLFLKPERSTS